MTSISRASRLWWALLIGSVVTWSIAIRNVAIVMEKDLGIIDSLYQYDRATTYVNGTGLQLSLDEKALTLDKHLQMIGSPIPSSPYAYVFMLWRFDPSDPGGSYRGYIANLLIAAKLLRKHGSKADIIAILQLSHYSTHFQLPSEYEQMLSTLNIQVRYLPKETATQVKLNVGGSMFTKFHVYSMTEYQRVLYLDSDILPLANLDYLFDLSMQGVLKPNVLISGVYQPANGGFFLIEPNARRYEDIQRILQSKGERLGDKALFDPVQGWGHRIEPPDRWETNHPRTHGTSWTFVSTF
jgi:hypothetical protein